MNNKQKYLIISLLIVSSLIAFGRIAGNDFVNYDDPRLITENSKVKSGFNAESIKWALTDFREEYWHPLTSLSLILDWQLFGENASGHHIVSLLWHIGAMLLLFLFLNRTTGQPWPAAFAAAIFALHPLRVESVAWASERKDVLSMFFGMATLYAYSFYVEDKKISRYLICLLMFAFALMSKPMIVTLPCVLLLLDLWPLERWPIASAPPVSATENYAISSKRNDKKTTTKEIKISAATNRQRVIKKLLVEKVPFFILSFAASIHLIWGLNKAGYLHSLEELLLSDRINNAVVSYVVYLRKFFWPVDLAVFYPYQSIYHLWQILGAFFILSAITGVAVVLWKKAPFLFVGWFWYLGTIFPVIGLLQTGIQTKADRYTYLPSIGIAIMLVWGILHIVSKEKLRKIILLPAAILFSVALTILTWQQSGHWKDSISLFTHALKVTEDNFVAHINLAATLNSLGKHDEAMFHGLEAIKIVPDNYLAHQNTGMAMWALGKKDEAIAYFLKSLEINPDNHAAHIQLAVFFASQKRNIDAKNHFLEAIKIKPADADAHYMFGKFLEEQGKTEDAADYYNKAIRLNPGHELAHYNLSFLLIKQKQLDEAAYHLRQTIKINKENFGAHYNLAEILTRQGKTDQAIEHFREAVRIDPGSFKALNNLGVHLENKLQHDEAIHYYRLALPLEPKNPRLHFNLGVALGNRGDLIQAIEHFSRAVELKPDYKEARQALNMAREMQKQN